MAARAEEFDDGRSLDPNAIRQITQQWVDRHMKEKEAQFTEKVLATIFCGTWNVNAKKQDGGLGEWLLPTGQPLADVYAVGFQEIVDLTAMNVALDGSKSLSRSQFWRTNIADCLDFSGTKYVMIADKCLVGVYLCVFIKESISSHVRDVRTTSTGVGVLGMGNKGGVAVRMSLYDSSICFVCSHLAAHRENVAARNSDYKNIFERSIFAADGDAIGGDSGEFGVSDVVRPRHGADKTIGHDLTVPEHEFIFWLGDLNYRITDDLSTDDVFAVLEGNDLEFLRQKDQLNIERARGRVFHNFQEGLLEFSPTYKFQPGTNEYDRRPEKKIRAPAWCDRVLWRTAGSSSGDGVRLISYRSAQLLPSDHKPVSALFDCDLRTVIAERERAAYGELMRTLEYWKNDKPPTVSLDQSIVEFEGPTSVRYEVPAEAVLRITNSGAGIVHWRFVSKLEEQRLCKRWINLSLHSGLLLPGEEAAVVVSVTVDRITAQGLNAGREGLDDVLVLRVENAHDIFVPVHAEYCRSCYGMPLEELVVTMQPVRQTALPAHRSRLDLPADDENPEQRGQETATSLTDQSRAKAEKRLGVPKEMWRLVDALWSGQALRERDLFVGVADPAEVTLVREAIDCGLEMPVCSPHAIVEALVSWIAALPKPLLPPDLYPSSEIEPSSQRAWSRRFLESLPPLAYNVFVYLLSFMREVLAEADYNRTNAQLLADLCMACMTPLANATYGGPADPGSKEDKSRRNAKHQYLQNILVFLLTTPAL